MIVGRLNPNLEIVIDLRLRGKAGEMPVTAIVDTGFSDFLTLPLT